MYNPQKSIDTVGITMIAPSSFFRVKSFSEALTNYIVMDHRAASYARLVKRTGDSMPENIRREAQAVVRMYAHAAHAAKLAVYKFYDRRADGQAKKEILQLFSSEPDKTHTWSEQDICEQSRRIILK